MAWEQFTASDNTEIDEFVSGLKRTNQFYFDNTQLRRHLVSVLTHKPEVEGWIFTNASPRYTAGTIMCLKRIPDRHISLFSYGRGIITKEIFYDLIETKMDDYVAGLGKTGWDINISKNPLNELSGITTADARTFLSPRKTTVITRDDVQTSFITVDPI